MNIIAVIMLVSYLVLTIAVGVIFTRKNKTAKSYMAADRGLPWYLLSALLFGELIGGSSLISNASIGFSTGLAGIWLHLGMAFGCILIPVFVMKHLINLAHRENVMSLPDAFGKMFDQRSRTAMLVVVLFVYMLMYSTQPASAAALLSPITGLSETALIWILGIVFLILVLTGGMKGVAWMNLVHSFVILAGIGISAFIAVKNAGGIDNLRAALPESYFQALPKGPWNYIATMLGTGLGLVGAVTTAVVSFSSRSHRDGCLGAFFAGFLTLLFAFLPCLIGMSGAVLTPESTATGVLVTVSSYISPYLGGIVAMAFFAAVWSSAPAILLIISTTLTKDFYCVFMNPNADDKQQLSFSRLMSCAFTIVCCGFAAADQSGLVNRVIGACQIRATVGLVLILGIWWKGATNNGAFWSIIIGGLVSAAWYVLGNPFGIACLWPGMAATALVMIIVSIVDKKCGSAVMAVSYKDMPLS